MPKSKSTIPDRWEAYSDIGDVIEGTQFITFKVPLKQTIQVKAEMKFTPTMLMETLESRNLQLGLVIDLTNTTRYYNKEEFEKNNVSYAKIFVPGHVVPSDNIFRSFAQAVETFLEQEETQGSLIGVHCTHGVNRTGYMVCRYMIEKLGIDPNKAIKAYRDARGYPIERENYLKDLRRRKAGVCTVGLSNESQHGEQAEASNHRQYNNGNPNRQYNQGNEKTSNREYNRAGWHSNHQGRRGHNERRGINRQYNDGNEGFGGNRHGNNDGRTYNGYNRRSNDYYGSHNNFDGQYQQMPHGRDRSYGNYEYSNYHQGSQRHYNGQHGNRGFYHNGQQNSEPSYYPRGNNVWTQSDNPAYQAQHEDRRWHSAPSRGRNHYNNY